MSIRREDKELIYNLGLLGGILGACLSVFLVVHLSNRAHEQNEKHSEYQETHAALARLSSPKGVPGELVVDRTIIKQMQEQIQQEQPEISQKPKQSFWLRIPRWAFLSICGGGCVAGAIAGFSTVWLTCWTGSVFTYFFIRSIYKTICKIAPNSKMAKEQVQKKTTMAGQHEFQRNENRILPVLVKLTFLLILVLSVLGAVVWHMAGM